MNPETIVIAVLDAVLDVHVAGRVPRTIAEPFARVHLIEEVPDQRSPALHQVAAYLQVDCYAGDDNSQATARDLATSARNALAGLSGVQDGGGVVTAVTGLSISRQPDGTIDPARERYVLSATVHGHPSQTP